MRGKMWRKIKIFRFAPSLCVFALLMETYATLPFVCVFCQCVCGLYVCVCRITDTLFAYFEKSISTQEQNHCSIAEQQLGFFTVGSWTRVCLCKQDMRSNHLHIRFKQQWSLWSLNQPVPLKIQQTREKTFLFKLFWLFLSALVTTYVYEHANKWHFELLCF